MSETNENNDVIKCQEAFHGTESPTDPLKELHDWAMQYYDLARLTLNADMARFYIACGNYYGNIRHEMLIGQQSKIQSPPTISSEFQAIDE